MSSLALLGVKSRALIGVAVAGCVVAAIEWMPLIFAGWRNHKPQSRFTPEDIRLLTGVFGDPLPASLIILKESHVPPKALGFWLGPVEGHSADYRLQLDVSDYCAWLDNGRKRGVVPANYVDFAPETIHLPEHAGFTVDGTTVTSASTWVTPGFSSSPTIVLKLHSVPAWR